MYKYIILAFIICFLFILNCRVKIFFSFERIEAENKTKIFVKYLFIKKEFKLHDEYINKNKTAKQEKKEQPERGIGYYKQLYKLLKKDISELASYLLKKAVVFDILNISVCFGYSDAAITGIMTGIQNSFVYCLMAFFHNNFHVRKWNVSINPDFQKERFDSSFDCIAEMKTAHIIIIGIKALKILRTIKKQNKIRKEEK